MQTVPNPGVWPANQRYDYLARLRVLSETQAEQLTNTLQTRGNSGQREAMLYALRELTGKDLGSAPEAWKQLFPQPSEEERSNEAVRLGQELIAAPAERQKALLDKLRESKGAAYTNALAEAIPKLEGAIHDQARDALMERLERMASKTLRDKCKDENAEVRRGRLWPAPARRTRLSSPIS
jgi:hypothetical protein